MVQVEGEKRHVIVHEGIVAGHVTDEAKREVNMNAESKDASTID